MPPTWIRLRPCLNSLTGTYPYTTKMKIFSIVALIILLNGLSGWWLNLPKDAGEDVPEGKLNSLSYAPFREGQGPIIGIFPTADHIETDLKLLSQKTRSIRTYASAEGTMPVIPRLARQYGLTMIQGAWLGPLDKINQLEIATVIRSAHANPDVVKRLIVGNEVLLRGDLEPEQLIQYIRTVKQAVEQPVSYADVWSMYMKYPQLIKEVDYITIHILPYWEDEPIAVDDAPAHIERIFKKVRAEADRMAPGKAILIGESGWPSAGRQRGFAVPGVANEARFIRGLIKVANTNGFDVNIVEAFNQPWKSKLEGVVGSNWGLFSTNRHEVFPLTGKVHENPAWYKSVAVSAVLFLIAAIGSRKPLQKLPIAQATALLLLMQVLLALWVGQVTFLWHTSYDLWQRIATIFLVGLNATIGAFMVWQGHQLFAKQPTNTTLATAGYCIYLVFAAYAVFETLSLAINGRYLSFPNWVTCIPAIGVVALAMLPSLGQRSWRQGFTGLNGQFAPISRRQTYNRSMAYLLLGSGLVLILGESYTFVASRDMIADYPEFGKRLGIAINFTLGNQQLLLWLASLAVLSLPLLANRKPQTNQTKQEIPS